MPRPDLQAIADKWIRLFRIQDRRITVSYVPNLKNPLNGDTVYALLALENDDEGRYSIFVQDPSTWPTNAARPPTEKVIEGVVRHECAHIRVRDFAPRNPSDADILAEERAVWAISDAFDAVMENDAPQFAAMVVQQLSRKPQTLAQVAGQIRAMTATAASRQTKGMSMDAKAVLAAIKDQDEAAALAILEQWLTEQISSGAAKPPGVPDPSAPPMGADVGNAANDQNKDKMPPDAMRAMTADVVSIRTMKGEIAKYHAEIKVAADLVRPEAKTAIVRAMRADGIVITPHGEKLILDAPTLEEAQVLAKGMRAMGSAESRKPNALPANGGTAGLTRAQSAQYQRLAAQGSPRAETYRAECVRDNAATKGGAK
jgi:hypothetical protein